VLNSRVSAALYIWGLPRS